MSPPRRPFGNQLPGRLPATMVKVLAAEMSDSSRLSRGKRYHQESAVTDITVGRGVATAEVQGSRSQPYVVTIEVEPGDGVPTRRDVWLSCTCPDDTGTGRDACKHAVAALMTLSTEIAIEPELLERWRSGRPSRDRTAEVYDLASGRRIESASEPTADVEEEQPTVDTESGEADETAHGARPKERDQIGPLLTAPHGAAPPSFSPAEPIEHRPTSIDQLDDVLDDALRHLRIRWE